MISASAACLVDEGFSGQGNRITGEYWPERSSTTMTPERADALLRDGGGGESGDGGSDSVSPSLPWTSAAAVAVSVATAAPSQSSWWEKTNWFRVKSTSMATVISSAAPVAIAQPQVSSSSNAMTATAPSAPSAPSAWSRWSAPPAASSVAPVAYLGTSDSRSDVVGSGSSTASSSSAQRTAQPQSVPLQTVQSQPSIMLATAAAPGHAMCFNRFVSNATLRACTVEAQGVPVLKPPSVIVATPAPVDASVVTQPMVASAPSPAAATLTTAPSMTATATQPTVAAMATTTSTSARPSPQSTILAAVQGYSPDVMRRIHENILLPLLHPILFSSIGMSPSRGVLLSGAPGSGKTSLVQSIVEQLGVYYHHVDGANLLAQAAAPPPSSAHSSAQEHLLEGVFNAAIKNAPAIVFIDEMDAIASAPKGTDSPLLIKVRGMLRAQMDRLAKLHALTSRGGGASGGGASGAGGASSTRGVAGILAQRKRSSPGVAAKSSAAASPSYSSSSSSSSSPSSPPPVAPRAVIVIGATNRVDALDPAFLRAGRFDRSIVLNKPDEQGRLAMLRTLTRTMKLGTDVDLASISRSTEGFVGSDLQALCTEAGLACIRKHVLCADVGRSGSCGESGSSSNTNTTTSSEPLALSTPCAPMMGIPRTLDAHTVASMSVCQVHFEEALCAVRPSVTRDVQVDIPHVDWSEVGGAGNVKSSLIETIEYPLAYASLFRHFGLPSSSGVLLYGPPGCGKTMMARAIASSCRATFISVKGPELLTAYFGDSEKRVRELFAKARSCSPCVIFFDEIDSVALRRGGVDGSIGGSHSTTDRVLNQLLTEMDGALSERASSSSSSSGGETAKPPLVFVVAATNRPELIDPALLRPGRFDQLLFVGLPDEASRLAILRANLVSTPLAEEVRRDDDAYLRELAHRTARFSGADMAHVVNQARRLAVQEHVKRMDRGGGGARASSSSSSSSFTSEEDVLRIRHFEESMRGARPSVSDDELERFRMYNLFLRSRSELYAPAMDGNDDDGMGKDDEMGVEEMAAALNGSGEYASDGSQRLRSIMDVVRDVAARVGEKVREGGSVSSSSSSSDRAEPAGTALELDRVRLRRQMRALAAERVGEQGQSPQKVAEELIRVFQLYQRQLRRQKEQDAEAHESSKEQMMVESD